MFRVYGRSVWFNPQRECILWYTIYILLCIIYYIGSIALARTSTDPLLVCNGVRVSVCPEEWYKKKNNGVYYKKRAEREASPLRSSTKNRIMGYTTYIII